eukprot:TRINITY_DN1689_c0_g1_i3.p1 TRINITY_DN1689_c0_g1~~TRINITY_DN1689_c0_g1_i3.p1  ORF type:complete len:122 (-),score=23.74 TRINITY_DN1689_c0_g1_i3:148-513(-)
MCGVSQGGAVDVRSLTRKVDDWTASVKEKEGLLKVLQSVKKSVLIHSHMITPINMHTSTCDDQSDIFFPVNCCFVVFRCACVLLNRKPRMSPSPFSKGGDLKGSSISELRQMTPGKRLFDE